LKNQYEIRGDVTTIFLKKQDGSVFETIISTSDLETLNKFPNTWFAKRNNSTRDFYARGHSPRGKNGERKTVLMHRWITNAPMDKVVDHINHNTLDNTKNNLRIVTPAENRQNLKGAQKQNKSGVRGVSWRSKDKVFVARIGINKKSIYLGSFKTKEEAELVVISAREKNMPFSKEGTKHAY
jgi:hypothetical protein